MRISGFASGFDIDAMVKQLMKAHEAPVNKLKKQLTRLEWQQDAYRNVSTTLVDFRNNKLANFGLSSSIDAKKAEVTGNTSAISATTTGGSTAGVMSIEVTQLAKAATTTLDTGISGANADAVLKDLPGWSTGTTGKILINGKEISYDPATDTIKSLVTKINNNKDAQVTAIYDAATGKMAISSKQTGPGTITLDGDLNGRVTVNSSLPGDVAKVKVNGLEMTSASNQITINGTTIQLKEVTAGSPSVLTISTNTDKIMDTIKSFVSEYNKVLDLVNGKLGEEKYRKYDPLTEEEEQAMSDKQVELWESRAKSGLLKNDSILSQTMSNLRMASTSNFGNPSDNFNIQSIGISTGKWYEGGRLVIENEEKLRKAIEEDPDKVIQLFTASSSSSPAAGYSKVNDPETGIFTRMSGILMDSLKQLSEKAGTSQTSTSLSGTFLETSLLGTQKKDLNSRITDMNRRLTMLETQYYKQFTAMETAINRYNSQAGSLASFMNG